MTRLATKNYKGMNIKEVKKLFKKERNIKASEFNKEQIDGVRTYSIEYAFDKIVWFDTDDNDIVIKVVTITL